MNYLKTYIDLIRKAENRTGLTGYVEKHHVFPKSIFGDNKRLVKLTAKEHYIAHALLEKICIKRYGKTHTKTTKMVRAFFLMNNAEGKGQERYINSNMYEHNKLRFSESISGENNHFYGKKRIFTEEHLANLRSTHKGGKENPLYGIPRSEEIKQKLRKPKHTGHGEAVSKGRQGIKFTEEHLKNLSESHKGQVSSMKGKKHTEESKRKMSTAKKNRPEVTKEYREKMSAIVKEIWAKRKMEGMINVA